MVNMILKILKRYTLFIVMLLGVVTYPWMSKLQFLTPYLIFIMLYLTFCRIDPAKMRIKKWHLLLLLIQAIGSVCAYFLFMYYDKMLAQGAMLCFLMPTAISAAVITGKLGGSVEEQTTYTLLSSMMVAIMVPFVFPLIMHVNLVASEVFIESFCAIIIKIFPILIFPFLLAWLTRIVYQKKTHKKMVLSALVNSLPFYLWAFSLTILMASTTRSLVEDEYNSFSAVMLAINALGACVLQFWVGKRVGDRYGQHIAAGQALGQKNTILGIWLAHTYLIPASALGVAAYIVWQNLFNAYQLAKFDKRKNNL